MTPLEQTYTVLEVAKSLKTSRQTIIKLIKAGKLKAIKVGNEHRIKESALQEYLK